MLKFFNKITPSSFFVFVALVCEILFNCTTPPLQAPDEFNHFYRAYQVSEGCFLPQQLDKRLGGQIPYALSDFEAPFVMVSTVSELRTSWDGHPDSFKQATSDTSVFRDFPNTAYYSPVSYLPQAFIIYVLKEFYVSPAVLYYAGRIFGFIACLLALLYVIRIIPVYKWLFTLLALLPMNLFIANSFSADTMTNILSFLFIGLVFRSAFDENKITTKFFVALAILSALLALAKLVYVGLVLLLFIIPAGRFRSRRHKVFFIAGIFALAFFCVFLWSSVVMKNYLTYEDYNVEFRNGPTLVPGASYNDQKAYILEHPVYFPKVILNSIFNPDQTYLSSYIGRFGAFLDVPMPLWLIIISYLVILFVTVGEKNEHAFSVRQRIVIFLSMFSSFVLLLLSQHLTWDPVGKGSVDLIQGRYLIPLFPLLFAAIGNPLKKIRYPVNFTVVPFVLFLNGFATWTLYERYVYEPYDHIKKITCDAESMDAYGNFKTSDKGVILQGCSNQSSAEKRNGSFSAVVSPTCTYCFTHVFKGFNKGDLVGVSAWIKGSVALTITGGRKDCGSFYNEFSDEHYVDRHGWKFIYGILVISAPCDTMDIGFFVQGKDEKTACVDDITLTLKKIKQK